MKINEITKEQKSQINNQFKEKAEKLKNELEGLKEELAAIKGRTDIRHTTYIATNTQLHSQFEDISAKLIEFDKTYGKVVQNNDQMDTVRTFMTEWQRYQNESLTLVGQMRNQEWSFWVNLLGASSGFLALILSFVLAVLGCIDPKRTRPPIKQKGKDGSTIVRLDIESGKSVSFQDDKTPASKAKPASHYFRLKIGRAHV